MNRPLTPSLSPSEGERVPEGRVRGWFMAPMRDSGMVELYASSGKARVNFGVRSNAQFSAG